MNKREVVIKSLNFELPPYVPWSVRLTLEAEEKLVEIVGENNLDEFLDNHFVELGSDIGFFEDLGDDLFKIVKADNISHENIYIQSVTMNGEKWNKTYFDHNDIKDGVELVFEMGKPPNKRWTTEKTSIPFSISE